jgi:hypothetical protein
MNDDQTYVRTLAMQYTNAGKPTEWFEVLDSQAKEDGTKIPWADMEANPNLIQCLGVHLDHYGARSIGHIQVEPLGLMS